jgi:PTS system nitrogen regulatory IIA component
MSASGKFASSSPFGATLRMLRLEAGMGLRELARQVGVSGAYLSRVETGRDPPPTAERLAAIAATLGVPEESLIGLAHRRSGVVDEYLERVPAAHALFLEVARRGLGVEQIARVTEFIASEFASAPEESGSPDLARLISAARICLGVDCPDLGAVITRGASLCVPARSSARAASLAALIHAREAEASTLIGNGFAVPHAIVEGARPVAALLTLARPLSAPTPDGKPITTAIVLVSGDRRGHLEALARIARLASCDAAAALATCASPRSASALLRRCDAG